ncbi:cell division control protein 2 homolog [Abrus precatorius]|uniref:cyclin-dependent kinase n=1 Tax=Abrus precatorius TaxID=3816 RepID=A0A8B8LGP4_ABRPR|nr:cell division control protein 2 homolog [Abrus precatorius]
MASESEASERETEIEPAASAETGEVPTTSETGEAATATGETANAPETEELPTTTEAATETEKVPTTTDVGEASTETEEVPTTTETGEAATETEIEEDATETGEAETAPETEEAVTAPETEEDATETEEFSTTTEIGEAVTAPETEETATNTEEVPKVTEIEEIGPAKKIEEVKSFPKKSPRLIHSLVLSEAQRKVIGAWYRDFIPIGTGRHGNVFQCKNHLNDQIFAVKVIPIPDNEKGNGVPYRIIREISVLKEIQDHINIVRLLDVLPSMDAMFLVFEHVDIDLLDFMRNPVLFIYPNMIKNFVHQILNAVAHCHSRKIIHRDLKPNNILIHFRTRVVKIADFGAARTIDVPFSSYSGDVGSSCYKAPELLFGSTYYSTSVDIWSVGCMFGEMALGRPLFSADSDWKMLNEMFTLLGTPTEETWPGVTSLCNYIDVMGPPKKPKDLALEFPKLDSDAVDLLSKMLCLCPKYRISAADAVLHPYFKGI